MEYLKKRRNLLLIIGIVVAMTLLFVFPKMKSNALAFATTKYHNGNVGIKK